MKCSEVNRIGKTFDMKMNAKKTKTMLVSTDVTSTKVSVKIDGDIIKQTDNYRGRRTPLTPANDIPLQWPIKRS